MIHGSLISLITLTLLVAACGSREKAQRFPAYADAADRSETCMEAVRTIAKRLVEEAETKEERRFAELRLTKLDEEPPTERNSACYEAHVGKDGSIRLNGIYTTDMFVTKTIRAARYNSGLTYTYVTIASDPGGYPKSIVFPLLEQLERLNLHPGLMTRYDAEFETRANATPVPPADKPADK